MKNKTRLICLASFTLLFSFFCLDLFGQAASRTDGVNVYYYDSLFEALNAADGTSIN